jgi:hypothetical protein
MATHLNGLPSSSAPVINQPAADERRAEPRFGAEGEVTVVVRDGSHDRELLAKLLDFSLHGLRVEMSAAIDEGSEVHVFFSWGEVTTKVMWSTPNDNGCEIGLQLF